MSASLVGSEMCIRDRSYAGGPIPVGSAHLAQCAAWPTTSGSCWTVAERSCDCLLYTSDAADDM
eukprot:1823189-Alexandrium_andersonii.AAC.1